jgi:putative NADPH-quinone reductase
MEFPLLRSKEDWDRHPPPPAVFEAQKNIRWAQHLVIIFSLWIGTMPALLKGFFEQTLRPGFAMALARRVGPQRPPGGDDGYARRHLSLVFRCAYGLKSVTQNLALVGIKPRSSTLIGMNEAMSDKKRDAWLTRLREFSSRPQ